ncbi:hypothetical protein RJ55_02471 [Drechmeria coniospora]|nr:hypothetical protein RJ55_02471 [Drechmeria coniospora]
MMHVANAEKMSRHETKQVTDTEKQSRNTKGLIIFENAVQKLLAGVYGNNRLPYSLGLQGTDALKSRQHLSQDDETVSESSASLTGVSAPRPRAKSCRSSPSFTKPLEGDRQRRSGLMPQDVRGSLFKVQLSEAGHTLAAKGAKEGHVKVLRHDNDLYEGLCSIQGTHIPVCLWAVNLALSHYVNNWLCTAFLFPSYAGHTLTGITGRMESGIIAKVSMAVSEIHDCGVLHHDAETRNALWDGKCVMVSRRLLEV